MNVRLLVLFGCFWLFACEQSERVDVTEDVRITEVELAEGGDFRSLMNAVRKRIADEPKRIRLRYQGKSPVVEFSSQLHHHGPGCPALVMLKGGHIHLGDGTGDDKSATLDELERMLELLVAGAEAAGNQPVLLFHESKVADLATGMAVMEMLANHGILVLLDVDL